MNTPNQMNQLNQYSQDQILAVNEIVSISFHPIINEFLFTPETTTKKKRAYNGTVDPIKSAEDIEAAKEYFLSQPLRYQSNPTNIRNYALFVLGCNCARRIGDILTLTIGDFLNEDHSFKDHFAIIEQKTNKPIKIKINNPTREALKKYFDSLDNYSLDDHIFKSREKRDLAKAKENYKLALVSGDEKKIKSTKERIDIIIRFGDAIEPRSAWRIMKDMSKAIGLDKKGINVGTHSCRKTWGYNALKANPTNPNQIVDVSEALNHSNIGVTRRYVGINQEEMDNLFDSVEI